MRPIIATLIAALLTIAGRLMPAQQPASANVYLPAIIAPLPTATATPTATSAPSATSTPTPTATTPAPSGPCLCDRNRYNCSSFSTHSQAQACFDWCMSQGAGDIHRLDQDNDGDVCESLPSNFQVVRQRHIHRQN